MTIAAVLIIGFAGIGIWYWMRIREKSKNSKDGDDLIKKDREPILITDLTSTGERVRENSGTQDTVLPQSQQVPQPEVQQVQAPAQNQENQVSAQASAKPAQDTAQREVPPQQERETAPQPQPAQPAKPVQTFPGRGALPLDELMRFDDIDKNGVPAHNPFIEELFRVNFRQPVAGSLLVQELATFHKTEAKNQYWVYALDACTNTWDIPLAIGTYSSVALIIRLSSSKGIVDELTISRFITFKQRLEMIFDGTSDEVDSQQITAKSNRLANYVSQFGVALTIYLRPESPVSVEEFGRQAAGLGFVRESDTAYEKLGEQIQTKDGQHTGYRKGEFRLVYDSDKELSLRLNVPLIPPEREPLRKLMMAANAFAAVFDARIVDISGNEIDGRLICMVKKEMNKFYAQMRDADLVPGSENVHLLLG